MFSLGDPAVIKEVRQPATFRVVWIGWMYFAYAGGIVTGFLVGLTVGILLNG